MGLPPPVRGRYSSGRVAEGRRMGASTLVGSDLLDLKKKMEHQQKVLASRPKPEQEMDDITKEIQERERLLKYEREREAALRKRLELDNQLKELQLQNDKMSNQLGSNAPAALKSTDVSDTMKVQRFGPRKAAVPAAVPTWLKYDKIVLRFNAYFKEPWFDSEGEGFDIRKFVISYYMQDKSVEIIEIRTQNSGTPQGCFMKRTKLLKSTGECYMPGDFAVGKRMRVNGRQFVINDAERATREYFANEFSDIIMAQPMKLPNVPARRAFEPGMGNDLVRPVQKKGRGERADHSQFLNMDGKVLEFIGAWDDNSDLQGGVRKLKIKYFLVDDTIEVNEMTGMNSGRDLTSRFRINRGRLAVPEAQHGSGVASFTSAPAKFYGPRDLLVGNTLVMFGREVGIVACNDFTRGYYAKVLSIEQKPNPANRRGEASDQPGHKYTNPQERLLRLQEGIRRKIETASNYGTMRDQQRALKHMFSGYDLDKSGFISKDEFFTAMGSFACFGADCDMLFERFDSSSDGKISIDEFIAAVYGDGQGRAPETGARGNASGASMQSAIEEATRGDTNGNLMVLEESLRNKVESMANFSTSINRKSRELEKLMKRYDTDGSGFLSLSEFRAALANLNYRNSDADALFKAYDADNNGQLGYSEFSNLLLGRQVPRIKPTFQGHNQWYNPTKKTSKSIH